MNNLDLKIIYADEEGTEHTATLEEIRQNLGWEYGIPKNVSGLISDSGGVVKEIIVNDLSVWKRE